MLINKLVTRKKLLIAPFPLLTYVQKLFPYSIPSASIYTASLVATTLRQLRCSVRRIRVKHERWSRVFS